MREWIHTTARFNSLRLVVVVLVLGSSCCIGLMYYSHYSIGLIDDAYITFSYARNLLEAGELSFNRGEKVEGYSNFFWIVIISALRQINIDFVTSARMISFLFLFSSCLVLVLYNRSNPNILLTVAGSSIILIHPHMIHWACSGLETTLFASLLLVSIILLAARQHSGVITFLGASVLVVASLVRPEGALIAGVVFVSLMFLSPKSIKRTTVLAIAFYIVLLLPYHFWRLSYFGNNLQNSFHAKYGWSPLDVLRHLSAWPGWDMLLTYAKTNPFLAAYLVIGNAACFVKAARAQKLFSVVFFTGAAFIFYIAVDWMGKSRFLVHFLPVGVGGALAGFASLKSLRGHALRIGGTLVVPATLLLFSIGFFVLSKDDISRPTVAQFVRSHMPMRPYIRPPLSASANEALWHLPEGCIAGIGDIGYFKFLTNSHVVDILAGLTEPARDNQGNWCYDEEYLRRRIAVEQPCALWIVTEPGGLPTRSREDAALQSAQKHGYYLSHILPLEERPDMGRYVSVWARPDVVLKDVPPEVVMKRAMGVLNYTPSDANARKQIVLAMRELGRGSARRKESGDQHCSVK
jgi:hypothetical protein